MVGFPAVSLQFPLCMKPVACGCACANPGPGCLFCLCPFSSSSPLCGVLQGPVVPIRLWTSISPLFGGAAGDRSAVLAGSPSNPSLPLEGDSHKGHPSGTPWWISDVSTGQRASQLPVPSSASYLCPNPVPVWVTPFSLSPFPSVCVRLLKGRIQVSSGNAFSLPRVRARTFSCPPTVRLELLLRRLLLPGKEAGSGCTAQARG